MSKIPYKGVEQKRGEGKKILKRGGGKLGQREGGWNPLTNYDDTLDDTLLTNYDVPHL